MVKQLSPLAKGIINLVGYLITWLVSAISAPHGYVWLGFGVGLIAVGIHLSQCSSIKHELKHIVLVTLMGIALESWLGQLHYLSFTGINPWYPVSPPWVWGVWLAFASTLNSSLAILQRHYYVAACCGSVDLPLNYVMAHNYGAVELLQIWQPLMILSLSWMILLPLAAWIATSPLKKA